jgi:hypothetical protein
MTDDKGYVVKEFMEARKEWSSGNAKIHFSNRNEMGIETMHIEYETAWFQEKGQSQIGIIKTVNGTKAYGRKVTTPEFLGFLFELVAFELLFDETGYEMEQREVKLVDHTFEVR